jgi:amino acid transporter
VPFLIVILFPDLCIPIFGGLYFGYKLWFRTKIWKTSEMDFWTVSLSISAKVDRSLNNGISQGIPSYEETEGSYVPPTTFWAKFVDAVV